MVLYKGCAISTFEIIQYFCWERWSSMMNKYLPHRWQPDLWCTISGRHTNTINTIYIPTPYTEVLSLNQFPQLAWQSKLKAIPTHSADLMVSDQAMVWLSVIGGYQQSGRDGTTPAYPNPVSCPGLLATEREKVSCRPSSESAHPARL